MEEGIAEAEREVRAIETVCLGEASMARFFFATLNRRSSLHILQSLFQKQPPNIFLPTQHVSSLPHYQWIVFCLLKWFGFGNDLTCNWDSLVERELAGWSGKISRSFLNAVSELKRRPTEETVMAVASVLLKMDEACPPFFEFWRARFEPFFKKIKLARLLEVHGFNAFRLFGEVDMKQVQTIPYSYTNAQDFETLFQVPGMWAKDDGFIFIQWKIVSDSFYPSYVMYETDVRERSLIETTIVKNRHFVDIVVDFVREVYYNDGKAHAYSYSKVLSKIAPWIFLSLIQDVEGTLADVNEEVPEFLSESPPLIRNVLERLLNDVAFFADIRRYTGQILSTRDFASKSYPMIMSTFLTRNPAPFQDFPEKPLMCISDEDRVIDSDFIWAALAISSLMRVMEGEDDAEQLLQEMAWFLEQMSDHDVRECVLVDLFSIMFLKKGDHFVCDKQTAESLLTTILGLAETPVLTKYAGYGHRHMQITRPLSTTESIDDVLIPKRQLLFEALEKHDWQIADLIASLRKSFRKLVTIYRAVAEYKDGSNESVPEEAAAEIVLAREPRSDLLAMAQQCHKPESEVQQLLSRRSRASNNMKVVKTLKSQYMSEIHNRFTRLSATTWPVPSLNKTNTKLQQLVGFMKYLDVLVGSLVDLKVVDTVCDALEMQPKEALDAILHAGKVEEAKYLAELLKVDMLDMILRGGSYPENVISAFTQQMPAVGLASLFSATTNDSGKCETSSKVCSRLMNLKVKTSDQDMNLRREAGESIVLHKPLEYSHVSLEAAYFVNQEFLNEADAWELIRSAFNCRDAEKVGELSFLVNSTDFSSFLSRQLDDTSFEFIARVCDQSSVTPEFSDEIDILLSIRDDVAQLFPLSDAFKSLVLQRKYLKAAELIRTLPNGAPYFELLRECLQTADEKEEILNICPQWKSKLLHELGLSEIVSDAFTSFIPPEWRDSGSPGHILSKHIDTELEQVIPILRRFPEINCDMSFVGLIVRVKSLEDVIARACLYFDVCRDLEYVRQNLRTTFTQMIGQRSVTDPDSEMQALQELKRVHAVMRMYGDKIFTDQLCTLMSVIEKEPMTKYHKSYTLSDLGSSLLPLTIELDMIDEFKRMSQLWDCRRLEVDAILEQYHRRCYEMSCFDVPLEAPNSSSLFRSIMDMFTHTHFYDPRMISEYTETFPPSDDMLVIDTEATGPVRKVRSLTVLSTYVEDVPLSANRRLTSEYLPPTCEIDSDNTFYQRLQDLASRPTQPLPSRSQMEPLYKIFFEKAPTDAIARYYSLHGIYQKALEQVDTITDQEKRLRVFRDDIMEVAISQDTFADLKVNMKSYQELFSSILPIAGPTLGYEMEMEFGMYREAGHTALELYKNSRNSASTIYYLEMAQRAMEKVSPRTQDDLNLLTGISIQRLFNSLVKEKSLDGHSGLNLFGPDTYKVSMVQLLFMVDELDLAITILQTYNLSVREVGNRLVDAMVNEDETAMVSFVQSFETRCRWNNIAGTFQQLVYAMVMRLLHTMKLEDMALSIVRTINNPSLKSLLLLQFNLYEEAATIALDNKITENIPLILHMWAGAPRSTVFSKCLKIIQ